MEQTLRYQPLRLSSFEGLRVRHVSSFGPLPILAPRKAQKHGIAAQMFDNLSERARKALSLAEDEAKMHHNETIGPAHVLLGVIAQGESRVAQSLDLMGITLDNARAEMRRIIKEGENKSGETVSLSSEATKAVEIAINIAQNSVHRKVDTEHLLYGLLKEEHPDVRQIITNLGVDPGEIYTAIKQTRGQQSLQELEKYATDLTRLAEEGRLAPFIGRDQHIERVIHILARQTKNNACIIGEPGVGKTAIVEGLAQRIVAGNVPEKIKNKKIFSLNMGVLVAGTMYRGQFEERIRNIMEEVKDNRNTIVFIDEFHTVIGAGRQSSESGDMLKPALARGDFQCIGATTLEEYRQYVEKDKALERRFQKVLVPEPTVEETVEMLKGLRKKFEDHHRIRFSDEALFAAAKLSDQYIRDRFLPDKAIDLVDEAGSFASLRHVQVGNVNVPIVLEEDIERVVTSWTGIPVERKSKESEKLINLEDTLHKRVIGQAEAVSAISKAMRRARMGFKDPNRPIASFLFTGPTGVGKTELAKALAGTCFASEQAIIRIDMSEYMEKNAVSRLIGAPPGYIGFDESGQLTKAVRNQPYSVVLLDEIEKAHPDVLNLLLQVLDDGRLTDSNGRVVDFKNTVIIMTSNIGSYAIEKKEVVVDEMKKLLTPEFINRIDEIVVFKQLRKKEVKDIAQIMVKKACEKAKVRGVEVQVTDRFRDYLVDEGYDKAYGARPMRRAIQKLLENPLAEEMLNGKVNCGDRVIVDVDSKDKNVSVRLRSRPLWPKPNMAQTVSGSAKHDLFDTITWPWGNKPHSPCQTEPEGAAKHDLFGAITWPWEHKVKPDDSTDLMDGAKHGPVGTVTCPGRHKSASCRTGLQGSKAQDRDRDGHIFLSGLDYTAGPRTQLMSGPAYSEVCKPAKANYVIYWFLFFVFVMLFKNKIFTK
ncbi:hypothetical protein J5N97_022133 [Dioscorea zingiberensis]|uniref:Clp R domain-containing protein n=1 Tax=Dioscorea zingiberensis TaxID=325984 RepID=A0A9D5HAA2_9LILI|nr:hypothetical protein J5N97_022133 [Dioscorea zingiberensis]